MANFIVRYSELYHVGNKNSGRYPRGSGERPYQHDEYQSKRRIRHDIESVNESTRNKIEQVINSEDYKNASSKLKQYVADTAANITPYINDTRSGLKSSNKRQLQARLNNAMDHYSKIREVATIIHIDGVTKRWDDIATQHNIPTDVKNAVKNITRDAYIGNKYSDSDKYTIAKFLNTLPMESHTDKFWSHIDNADKNDWLADTISNAVYDSEHIDQETQYAYIDGWIDIR